MSRRQQTRLHKGPWELPTPTGTGKTLQQVSQILKTKRNHLDLYAAAAREQGRALQQAEAEPSSTQLAALRPPGPGRPAAAGTAGRCWCGPLGHCRDKGKTESRPPGPEPLAHPPSGAALQHRISRPFHHPGTQRTRAANPAPRPQHVG